MILKSFIFYSLCFYLKKNSFFENEYFLNMFELIKNKIFKFQNILLIKKLQIYFILISKTKLNDWQRLNVNCKILKTIKELFGLLSILCKFLVKRNLQALKIIFLNINFINFVYLLLFLCDFNAIIFLLQILRNRPTKILHIFHSWLLYFKIYISKLNPSTFWGQLILFLS